VEDGNGGGIDFKIVLAILCVIAVVGGGTVIGKWAKVGCELGHIFGSCPAAVSSAGNAVSSAGNQAPAAGLPAAGYFYSIRARHSGKCLDVAWASQADSEHVNQFTCKGSTNQQWYLVRV